MSALGRGRGGVDCVGCGIELQGPSVEQARTVVRLLLPALQPGHALALGLPGCVWGSGCMRHARTWLHAHGWSMEYGVLLPIC